MPFTIDTGVLIALDRPQPRRVVRELVGATDDAIIVCANSVVEWWGGGRCHERILSDYGIEVAPVETLIAKLAAEALRRLDVPREDQVRLAIDATVLATAAFRGGLVLYTGDLDDMARLAEVHDVLSTVELRPIPR